MRNEGRDRKIETRTCPFGGACPKLPPNSLSASRTPEKRVQVLMYHRICRDEQKVTSRYVVSKSTFRKQMEFLTLRGFCTPTIDNILSGTTSNCRAGRHPIIVTFDDGYLDTYENAFPILQEFGLSPIIFVVADFSLRANTWDRDCDLSNAELLRRDHIRAMSDSGIQFGIHSFTHASLPTLSDADLDRELNIGKSALEGVVHQPLPILAYPYGDVDERVKVATKRAGYKCAFSSYSGPLKYTSDLFEIRRIFMTDRSSQLYLLYKASGLDHFLRWAIWYLKELVGVPIRYKQRPRVRYNRDGSPRS